MTKSQITLDILSLDIGNFLDQLEQLEIRAI